MECEFSLHSLVIDLVTYSYSAWPFSLQFLYSKDQLKTASEDVRSW